MSTLPGLRPGLRESRPRPRKVIRPTRPFLGSVWTDLLLLLRYTALFRAMTATRLKVRYRHSVLGWLWAVVQPLALMVLYVAAFSHLSSYDTGAVPYPLFVIAGLLPWSFCSTALSTAAGGMLSHQTLMAKVYFPREIVPLSYVAAALVDFLIAFVVMIGMMLFYRVALRPEAFFAVPIAAILALQVAGLCLLLSAVQVRSRDINVMLPMMLQVLLFTAPVLYPAAAVPEAFRGLYWANPLAILVDAFRQSVLGGVMPGLGSLLYCLATGMVLFVLAFSVFQRLGAKLVDEM
jgi:lipopolysaccharide transport system permease protein